MKPLILAVSGLLAICLLPLSTREQNARPAAAPGGGDLVSLPVVVTTHDGTRVADLQTSDFQVYEEKVRQQIAGFQGPGEPFSVLLALETSGCTEAKLRSLQDEAIRFVNLLNAADPVAVISFAEDVTLLQDFTADRAKIAAAVRHARPGSFSALYEAVWLAVEEVIKPVRGRSALVLLAGGVDTASGKVTKGETREIAKESPAPIFCIYFSTEPKPRTAGGADAGPDDYMGGHQYLTDLAENSGGRVFDALKMEDLGPAFGAVAGDLSCQYTIGYYSTNRSRDGSFRKVEVKVSRPALSVRTRKGYWAADDTIR